MATVEKHTASPDRAASERASRWSKCLLIAGTLGAISLALVGVLLSDFEAMAVAVGYGVSLFFLRRGRGRLGAVGISLVSLITLFFMGTAALTNARIGSDALWVLIPALLSAVAAVGLVAGIAAWLEWTDSRGPIVLVGLALTWVAGMTVWSITSTEAEASGADVSLVAENVAFTPTELVAANGDVTIEMTNRDLFWHTFTIDALGVDLLVPVGGERSVTFQVEPGIYDFICRIPGHPEAGMTGVLVVQEE
jgi:plastocyanin